LIQNLVFKNNVLIGRKGFAAYNATSLGNLRPKGIHRAGNKKLYLAYNGILWKNKDVGDTSFVKVDSLADTLASANYVSFLDFNDTTWLVDGRNFWKTTGDSLMRGNVVWQSKVSIMLGDAVTSVDTVRFDNAFEIWDRLAVETSDKFGSFNVPVARVGTLQGGVGTLQDTIRWFFKIDLSGLEVDDSILGATCSLFVRDEESSTDETLMLHRTTANYTSTLSWNNQPAVGSNAIDSVAITASNLWFTFNIAAWVDSVVNRGIANTGLRIKNRDESNSRTAKGFYTNPAATSGIKISIQAFRKTKLIQAKPRLIIDTTAGGLWPVNRWQGYYVEFVSESASADGDFVRRIDSTSYDTLFLDVPLISPNWRTTRDETYRIVAYPTTIDDIFTNKVDSFTTVSAGDSTRKIWFGAESVDPSTYNNNHYYFKVTSGRGQGFHQILYGGTTSTLDWIAVFSPSGVAFDSTTRFTILQPIFPKCKYLVVRGNQAIFAGDSLNPDRLWWSEPKVLGEVGGLNFHVIGGEPAEGQITAIRSLFVSNYSDPRNPLIVYKPQSVNGFFGSDISTDVPIKILDKFGTVSDRSVISVQGSQYFHATDKNFYAANGQTIELLSNKIKTTIDSIADSTLYRTAAFYYDRNIYWSVKQDAGSAYKTLAYNIDNKTWTEHTFRFGQATHINLANDSLVPIVFTNPDTGKVYKFGKAISDLAANITATITTRWFDMGQPDWKKRAVSLRGLVKTPTAWLGMWAVLSTDASGFITYWPVDSVYFGVGAGTTNLLRYFNNRPTSKHFQIQFKTYAAAFSFGGVLLEYMPIKKEGY